MYKFEDGFYMKIETYDDEVVLRRVSDGEYKHIQNNELNLSEYEVSLKDSLDEFYEAQWIGTGDLEKMTIALLQEANEAFNELDWKPWKNKPVNIPAYQEELADIGIFLLLCAKLTGLTFDDLFRKMYEKHLFNLTRLDHKERK